MCQSCIIPHDREERNTYFSFLLIIFPFSHFPFSQGRKSRAIRTEQNSNAMLRVPIPAEWKTKAAPQHINTVEPLFGAPSGTRTLGTLIKSQVLYQLS